MSLLIDGGKGLLCPFNLVVARDWYVPSIWWRQGTVMSLQFGGNVG